MPTIINARVVRCPPRWLMLRIETSDGDVGWGEAIGDLHEEVEASLEAIIPRIIGESASEITRLVDRLHRGRFWRDGPVLNTAVSAVEMALWDAKGKALGTPIYELFGGKVRDKVLIYRNLWGNDPASFADSATAALKEGLIAAKVSPAGPTNNITTDDELSNLVDIVAAVRDALGNHKLAIDLHGRLSPSASKRALNLISQYDPWFVEEPMLPGSTEQLREFKQLHLEQSIPLATGERLLTLREFTDILLPTPAVSVIQPDLSLVGGISQGMAIGAMADAAQVTLAPHCPYGPVQTAASIQVAAASIAHGMQEVQSLGGAGLPGGQPGGGWSWSFELLSSPFKIDEGFVKIPTKPGLGIEVCEDRIEEHSEEWKPHPPPQWNLVDGTMAEW